MINSIKDTLNPKGGHGVTETIIVVILILAIVMLNVMEIPVSNMLEYMVMAIIGYVFGSNNTTAKWDGNERREDVDSNGKEVDSIDEDEAKE